MEYSDFVKILSFCNYRLLDSHLKTNPNLKFGNLKNFINSDFFEVVCLNVKNNTIESNNILDLLLFWVGTENISTLLELDKDLTIYKTAIKYKNSYIYLFICEHIIKHNIQSLAKYLEHSKIAIHSYGLYDIYLTLKNNNVPIFKEESLELIIKNIAQKQKKTLLLNYTKYYTIFKNIEYDLNYYIQKIQQKDFQIFINYLEQTPSEQHQKNLFSMMLFDFLTHSMKKQKVSLDWLSEKIVSETQVFLENIIIGMNFKNQSIDFDYIGQKIVNNYKLYLNSDELNNSILLLTDCLEWLKENNIQYDINILLSENNIKPNIVKNINNLLV